MHVQLKAALVALAVFVVYDAAMWDGHYRTISIHKLSYTTQWVMNQDWG